MSEEINIYDYPELIIEEILKVEPHPRVAHKNAFIKANGQWVDSADGTHKVWKWDKDTLRVLLPHDLVLLYRYAIWRPDDEEDSGDGKN